MSYLIRRVLAKPCLILDEMCHLYGKFASYLRLVLCKTRLIFPRLNGPNVNIELIILPNIMLFSLALKTARPCFLKKKNSIFVFCNAASHS